jgi:hypothetical protein
MNFSEPYKESFEESLEIARNYLADINAPLILIGVTDDTFLREHFLTELRKRLGERVDLLDFRYDPQRLSLIEGALAVINSDGAEANGHRLAVSATGLETLTRDKQSEAIKLLNAQRNSLGYAKLIILLWLNHALYTEVARKSYDFYSCSSYTFFLDPPSDWNPEEKLASQRRSYLQAVVNQNEYVNLAGLAPMRGGQIVQMRMDEIFVPLRVEHEVESEPQFIPEASLKRRSKSRAGRRELDEEEEAALDEEEEAALRESFRLAPRERESVAVEITELLKEKRAVALGDPGAGKTTLLRYVAYRLAKSLLSGGGRESERVGTPALPGEVADQTGTPALPSEVAGRLPVYVRIGLYAQHLQNNPDIEIADFAPLGCQMLQTPLPTELLRAEMKRGRALFLLDGLDEIVDTSQRREVVRRVTEFANKYPDCPVIVTSRIVGYREAQLGSQFTQFTLSPFSQDEINRFVENWSRALGEPHKANDLIQAIDRNDSVKRLASNPLLLTVIALIHRRARLPEERVKLYQMAAETLADQWMNERRVVPEDWDAQETIRDLLPAIAWQMHRSTSSGLIGEQELQELLVETMRRLHPRWTKSEAHARAAQFRRNVAEFSGIFLERGLDREGRGLYGFLHLTFEEYFAAVRLCELWEREGDQALKPLMRDPRWNEIILLAAGRFSDSSQFQATKFVQAILEADNEYEDVLHRDLFWAARCLGDNVRVYPELREEIVNRLCDLYFNWKSPRSLREDIRRIFALLGGTAAGDDLVEVLLKLSSDNKRAVRSAAAGALKAMGEKAAREDVIAALLKLLSDANVDVWSAAAGALGAMGEKAAREDVIAALLKLSSDADLDVRFAVVSAIESLASKVHPRSKPAFIKLVLPYARGDKGDDKREVGYVALQNLMTAEVN